MANDTDEARTPRVSAIEHETYLAEEKARAELRTRQGWSRAHAKQNQMLPYGGSFLSPGDVALLQLALDRSLASETATDEDLLGAALLSAVMTTGRDLDHLSSAAFGAGSAQMQPPQVALRVDPAPTWWFAPGAPTSQQHFIKIAAPVSAARPASIPLACSERTWALIRSLHGGILAGQVFPGVAKEFEAAFRKYVLAAGVRASVRRVEGWMFQRLLLAKGGDTAIAALITGRSAPITQTVVHYTALGCEDMDELVAGALKGFDKIAPQAAVAPAQGRIGSRFAPTMAEAQALVLALSQSLLPPGRGRRRAPVSVHNAMTTYTIAFTHFATGGRPSRYLLPDDDAIDPATGFMVVDDKPMQDNFKSRIVWVPHECREQLRLYRAHLRKLITLAPTIEHFTAAEAAPFYLTPELAQVPVTRSSLRSALKEHHWAYPLNAGRHFLRTALVGQVSTETLHAMLGHWHIGTESWGAGSALDPLAYRMDLTSKLAPLLLSAGWIPRGGL